MSVLWECDIEACPCPPSMFMAERTSQGFSKSCAETLYYTSTLNKMHTDLCASSFFGGRDCSIYVSLKHLLHKVNLVHRVRLLTVINWKVLGTWTNFNIHKDKARINFLYCIILCQKHRYSSNIHAEPTSNYYHHAHSCVQGKRYVVVARVLG